MRKTNKNRDERDYLVLVILFIVGLTGPFVAFILFGPSEFFASGVVVGFFFGVFTTVFIILGTGVTTKQKPRYILSKDHVFDTSIAFMSSRTGSISYGAWGYPIMLSESKIDNIKKGHLQVGFKADNPEYSWGRQLDGTYLEYTIHTMED